MSNEWQPKKGKDAFYSPKYNKGHEKVVRVVEIANKYVIIRMFPRGMLRVAQLNELSEPPK